MDAKPVKKNSEKGSVILTVFVITILMAMGLLLIVFACICVAYAWEDWFFDG
jgi:hypothetical protein